MLIAAAGTSYHTPSVILIPGLTLELWPALFLWKYSSHYLSLSCSLLYLLDLSQCFTYICCPAWLLLTLQHKRTWQLPFIHSIQSCWTQEMLSQDNRIQLPNGMCRLSNAVILPFSICTDRYTVRGTKSLSIWVLWVKLWSKVLHRDPPSSSTSIPFPLLSGFFL